MNSYSPNVTSSRITPRALTFDFKQPDSQYWLDNCPMRTYFANALSLFIPESERFFIRSTKVFTQQIQDPELKSAVNNFIKQESNHSRAHREFIRLMILPYYPDLGWKDFSFPITAFFAWLGGKKMRLAMTAVGEHFTAVISDYQLRHPEFHDGVPEQITTLWRWHCIEEIEHKAVAYDVLQSVSNSYFLKLVSFIVMTLFFSSSFIKIYWRMMKRDRLRDNKMSYGKIWQYLWSKPGVLKEIIQPYFRYLQPAFHPWQYNNRGLIQQWEQNLQYKQSEGEKR